MQGLCYRVEEGRVLVVQPRGKSSLLRLSLPEGARLPDHVLRAMPQQPADVAFELGHWQQDKGLFSATLDP